MDYKEKVIVLLNSQELSKEQKEKLESIFPELKESEDGRIRKDMIETIKKEAHDFPSSVIAEKSNSWIAWLEKQGEHAKFRDSIQVGDKVTRNQDGMLVNLSQLNRVAKKQGEQKPAWSEEDGEIVETLNEYVKNLDILFSEIKIGNKDILSKEFRKKVQSWLKSLKERVQPQPKQWSEEDDQYLLVCKNALAKYQVSDKWDAIIISRWLEDKLKSLRPQNTWKPSDEQMNALNYVVNLMASSERPTENDLYYNILKSLRQQLMKLKG